MNNKRFIVLLGHQARVGKDTAAEELVTRSQYKRIAFADKLKDVCADLYDLSVAQLNGDYKNVIDERYNLTPRQILQKVGQAQFEIDNKIWAKNACKKVLEDDKKIVISDFRFPAEIEYIKNHFNAENDVIITIKITREGIDSFIGNNDTSEKSLVDFPWDYTIKNDGTINDLYHKVMECLSHEIYNSQHPADELKFY